MSHPKDDQLHPIGSKVAIIKGFNFGKTAVITKHAFQKDGRNFLNYEAHIDGRVGTFAIYHDTMSMVLFFVLRKTKGVNNITQ